jgi:hypothetical protein
MMGRGGGQEGMQGRGQEGAPPPGYVDQHYYNNNNGMSDNSATIPRGQDLYYASSTDAGVGAIGQAIEMDERHGLPSPEDENFARQPQAPYTQHERNQGHPLPSALPNHLQVGGDNGEARSPTSVYSGNGAHHE